MKSFKIVRNAWHYKLNQRLWNEDGWNARSMELNWEPRHRDFCSYWKATVLRLIALTACVVAAGATLLGLGVLVYEHPLEMLKTVGVVIGVIAAVVGLVVAGETLKARRQNAPPGLLSQRIRASKNRICPSVEYGE